MKTPKDVINRFINEENVKFNQEHDDWIIEAMEEYAKLYHESEVKKLNIPTVSDEFAAFKEYTKTYIGLYEWESFIKDFQVVTKKQVEGCSYCGKSSCNGGCY